MLCACAAPVPPEASLPEQEPAQSQELDSIVEPLENIEISPSQEEESGAEPETESAPLPAVSALQDEAPPLSRGPAAQDNRAAPPEENKPISAASKAEAAPSREAFAEIPDVSVIETELLRLINAERTAAGAEPLGLEDNMRFAAKIRAGEARQSFTHTRPNGTTYNTAFDEAGFLYAGKWHGENLAYLTYTPGTFSETKVAQSMFDALKASPGHYQNMLNDKFLQAGIGVVANYENDMITVTSAQMFSSL